MSDQFRDHWILLGLFLFSLFFFSRTLNAHGLEYRDDEIFYYQSTQEMFFTRNYFTPTYFGEYRFQKPILFYWLILASYKIFGINWFSARIVASVFGSLTVLLTYLLGKKLFSRAVGVLGGLILITIPMFFRHAQNAVPDMPLNFFIVLSLYAFYRFTEEPAKKRYNLLFFVACGLGFMIKGFSAIVIPMLTIIIYRLWAQKTGMIRRLNWLAGMLIILVILLPWLWHMYQTFGNSYFDYIFQKEAKYRIIGDRSQPIALTLARNFWEHSVFYLGVIFSYFAPWCLFFFASIPFVIRKINKMEEGSQGLMFLCSWAFASLFFFSGIFFVINHYLLVMTVPFSLLVSYFFLTKMAQNPLEEKMAWVVERLIPGVLVVFSFIVLSFLYFFLNNGSWLGWSGIFLIYIILFSIFLKNRKPAVAAIVLLLSTSFIYSQSHLITNARLVSISTLQHLSEVIKKDGEGVSYKVGVGSNDIHEKELQIYFDERIEKVATSVDHQSRAMIHELWKNPGRVYCVFTRADWVVYEPYKPSKTLQIMGEDYIIRKRMRIDQNFFMALIKFDKQQIHDYFMEKVFIVKKNEEF